MVHAVAGDRLHGADVARGAAGGVRPVAVRLPWPSRGARDDPGAVRAAHRRGGDGVRRAARTGEPGGDRGRMVRDRCGRRAAPHDRGAAGRARVLQRRRGRAGGGLVLGPGRSRDRGDRRVVGGGSHRDVPAGVAADRPPGDRERRGVGVPVRVHVVRHRAAVGTPGRFDARGRGLPAHLATARSVDGRGVGAGADGVRRRAPVGGERAGGARRGTAVAGHDRCGPADPGPARTAAGGLGGGARPACCWSRPSSRSCGERSAVVSVGYRCGRSRRSAMRGGGACCRSRR